MKDAERTALIAALQWHADEGAAEPWADESVDATLASRGLSAEALAKADEGESVHAQPVPPNPTAPHPGPLPGGERESSLLGTIEIRQEAARLAKAANTLDELRAAIAAFDGIALKKTATNLVFCDGNPKANVMLVGEAPGADEDRLGRPFVGVSGQLLDKILAFVGLDRTAEDPDAALYISNILNWRPPGNRTPSQAEIEASLPFIERHIALVKPQWLIFAGGVAAQALLGRTEGVSRLRGTIHAYRPRTEGIASDAPKEIPAIATYHPAYLLRTPSQKRAVWQDMLLLQQKRSG